MSRRTHPPALSRVGPTGKGRHAHGMLAALAAVLVATGVAAEVKVRAEVNATRIGVEDELRLTVVVEGGTADVEDVTLPKLDGLQVVGGPSVSTQVSIVNVSISQSRRLTWVLQPLQIGRTEIGPIAVRLRDGERMTDPIAIDVVAGSVAPPSARPIDPFADFFGPDPFEQAMGRRRAQTGKIHVEAVASRKNLRVGEPLLVTYYLYTQVRLSGIDFAEVPKYQGFWAEDLPKTESGGQPTLVTRDGEQYQRFTVFRKLLFPTKAGKLTVPAATFRVSLPRQVGFFADPLPGAAQVVARSSNPLEINALPLPEEPGFSGAVGSFRVMSSVDRNTLSIGDAATLRFRVEGSGNLKWVERAPEVAVPGAKVYPPQTKSDLTVTEAGVKGSRTWEYVIVPETAGTLALPPLTFVYFDPTASRLVHAASRPLELTVRQSTVALAQASSPAAPAAATGLRIRSELDLPGRGLPRLGRGATTAVVLLALALHALLLGSSFAFALGRRGEAKAPRRSVRHALAELRRAGGGGMSKESAAMLLERALVDVFGAVDERADGGGERERSVREVLHEVRFIRYAPQLGEYSEKIREVAKRAAEVVRRWA